MTTTPRLLNRLILIVGGLILLSAGVVTIASVINPSTWTRIAALIERNLLALWKGAPAIGEHSTAWFAVLLVCLVVILLAILVMSRQGRGRTEEIVRHSNAATEGFPGSLTIRSDVAEQVLRSCLETGPIRSVKVACYRVRRQTVLRLRVAVAAGTSPMMILDSVRAAITEWDRQLGQTIPVVIELRAQRIGNTALSVQDAPPSGQEVRIQQSIELAES